MMDLWVRYVWCAKRHVVDSIEMTETNYDETREWPSLSYLEKWHAERILCWL